MALEPYSPASPEVLITLKPAVKASGSIDEYLKWT